MMDATIYLIAVTLSQSATLAIGKLRRAIFRENAAVSAYAFPALIPLAWSTYRPLADQLPHLVKPQHPLIVSDPKAVSSSRFIGLDAGSTHCIEQWQQRVEKNLSRDAGAEAATGLFPSYPGIYLYSGIDSTLQLSADTIPAIDDVRITCFGIHYDDSCQWWEDLTYTELWSKHIS